jgi:hypothetical protein
MKVNEAVLDNYRQSLPSAWRSKGQIHASGQGITAKRIFIVLFVNGSKKNEVRTLIGQFLYICDKSIMRRLHPHV